MLNGGIFRSFQMESEGLGCPASTEGLINHSQGSLRSGACTEGTDNIGPCGGSGGGGGGGGDMSHRLSPITALEDDGYKPPLRGGSCEARDRKRGTASGFVSPAGGYDIRVRGGPWV